MESINTLSTVNISSLTKLLDVLKALQHNFSDKGKNQDSWGSSSTCKIGLTSFVAISTVICFSSAIKV